MTNFLDILPLIFYFIAGSISITYQICVGNYKIKTTKKIDILCLVLVIFFAILSIASSIFFWLLY